MGGGESMGRADPEAVAPAPLSRPPLASNGALAIAVRSRETMDAAGAALQPMQSRNRPGGQGGGPQTFALPGDGIGPEPGLLGDTALY